MHAIYDFRELLELVAQQLVGTDSLNQPVPNVQRSMDPLPTNCSFSSNDENSEDIDQSEDHENEVLWFYTSAAARYVVELGAVCVAMLISTSLRHAYFKFADDVGQIISLFIAINMVRLRRKPKISHRGNLFT